MIGIFGYEFRYFWPPRGVKRANFQKSLKKLFKGYINIICANFQVSNPYLLRKLDQNLFSAPKSEFLAPKRGQKCEFQKIEKGTFRLLYEQHLYQISAFYPLQVHHHHHQWALIWRKITLLKSSTQKEQDMCSRRLTKPEKNQ